MDVQMPTVLPDAALAHASVGSHLPKAVTVQTVPATVQVADAQSQTSKPTSEQIQQAIEKAQQITQPIAQSLDFSVDESSGQTVIKVVDSTTKEVIRQMPSKEFLELSQSLEKLSGLLLRQKA